jgi:hypothetical protein
MRELVAVAVVTVLALPASAVAADGPRQQNPYARLFTVQSLGTVAGTVRDVSGARLSGVTVEVANPALIEKIRTAVTDGAGAYIVVDLPVGTYTVTFSLPGFNTLHREGIEVAAGVTTTADGALRVWSISETVTGRPPALQLNPLPSPTVVCGMTIRKGAATLDPKMLQHLPENVPKPMLGIIPAPACQK